MFRKAPVAVKDLNAVVTMKEKNAATVPDGVMLSVYLKYLPLPKGPAPSLTQYGWMLER